MAILGSHVALILGWIRCIFFVLHSLSHEPPTHVPFIRLEITSKCHFNRNWAGLASLFGLEAATNPPPLSAGSTAPTPSIFALLRCALLMI